MFRPHQIARTIPKIRHAWSGHDDLRFDGGNVSDEIVKFNEQQPSPDAFVLAMRLMFCRAPKKAEPDADGFYSLGEIGSTKDKNWNKATPYSPAQTQIAIAGVKFDNERPKIAFVNDLNQEDAPFFW